MIYFKFLTARAFKLLVRFRNNINGLNLELYNKLIFKYFRRIITKTVNFEISLSEVPGVAI